MFYLALQVFSGRIEHMGRLVILLSVSVTSIALGMLMPTPTLQIALLIMGAVAIAPVVMLKADLALQANGATTFLLSASHAAWARPI